MKTAVLTVFYPGMESFLDLYIQCVNEQSDQNFELVIVDDNFPDILQEVQDQVHVPCHIVVSPFSPQRNRLNGLAYCREAGFELVVCSDSDETMGLSRVEMVKEFFVEHPGTDLLFNNTIYQRDDAYFDVDYRAELYLEDILDFNVLGYGAMNLRTTLVPFILGLENENISILDWWLGLQYLLHFNRVDFRSDIKNNYTCHPGNQVGPALEVTNERIVQSIQTKKNVYSEMNTFCLRQNKRFEAAVFREKLLEIEQIEHFIARHSLDNYCHRVKSYFDRKEKIFWWQEAVPLHKLHATSTAT